MVVAFGQTPLLLQKAALVWTGAVQVCELHMVPTGITQPGDPLHVPLQVPDPGHVAWIGAPDTFPQVPAGTAGVTEEMPPQYWHAPLHGVLQQTVSAQLLVIIGPALHFWPFLGLQVPLASQVWLPVQPLLSHRRW